MTLKFHKLEEDYLSLLTEFNTLKCKLDCKTESLLFLSQELEKCRTERDQFKLMADQLRTRYSTLKKRVEGWGPSLMGVYDVDGLKCERQKSLAQLLCELKDQNKALKYQVEDLKQRLEDAQGDIKILREEKKHCSDEYLSHSCFPFTEKEALVKQLEGQKLKCLQLTRDLEAVLDEKEELVSARDQHRSKYERLNHQMNYILRGDQKKLVDIDGVLMENKYLCERIQQVEEQNVATASALAKCRALLEKKRNKCSMRSTIASGLALSAKQVEQLLQGADSKSSNCVEFRNMVLTLLENLNDRSVALTHQKKANKLLGHRVTELEQHIKSMEVSCHIPDPGRFQYLFPELSESTPVEEEKSPANTLLDERSSEMSVGFSDLDILPTKDDPPSGLFRQGSLSSCSHYSDSKIESPGHLQSSEQPIKRYASLDDLPLRLQLCVSSALADMSSEESAGLKL